VGRVMAAGREFHADTIVCGIPHVAKETCLVDQTGPVHVAIASGPFSPDNMLIFDSISELEVRVRDSPPDILILCGPFLDINHPMVAVGTVEDSFGRPVTFEDVYKQEVIPKLSRLARACDNARTQLVIVPAVNEARYDYPLPQPPLSSVSDRIPLWDSLVKELPPNVVFASNPATIEIGNLRFLVTSTDCLSSLNSNILFKQSESSLPRVDACLDQLVRSRSLFPLMPSTIRIEPSVRYCLDMKEDRLPHVVVIPSLAGKRFIKKINERVFVNPGFMSDATGTLSSIAEIVVQPGLSSDATTRVDGELIKL
jgi:DNA polymerase alpha subunit B